MPTAIAVPQDYIQAHVWFNLAGSTGDADGIKERDRVAAKMTPDQISQAQRLGEDAFEKVVRPIEVSGQRASALRFGDARVQALFSVLVLFSPQLRGFTNQEVRALLAQLLGQDPANYPVGRMTYDLRRLRLRGIIARIPHSHRYQLTASGLRIALFFSRTHARLLRPHLAQITPSAPPGKSRLQSIFNQLQKEIDKCCEDQNLAA